MTSGRPTSIADKGPAAAPTTSTVSGEEQRAALTYADHPATRAFWAADRALQSHVGPRDGAEYAAKLKAVRERFAEWRLAMRALIAKETA
jgi:hypothetical protein